MKTEERIAKKFHETYERLAPEHDYQTRKRSAVPWENVPEDNKSLMIAVVMELLDKNVIQDGTTEVQIQPHEEIVARLRILAEEQRGNPIKAIHDLFTGFVRKADPWVLDPTKTKALSAMFRTLRTQLAKVESDDPEHTRLIKVMAMALKRYDAGHAALYDAVMLGNLVFGKGKKPRQT